jgi:Family of unknown function (DUF6807)
MQITVRRWTSRWTGYTGWLRLPARVALVVAAFVGPASHGRGENRDFQVERLIDGLQATLAGKPVFEYRSAENAYKPYVSKLNSPDGIQVLRDSPPDHQHHHALMFALGVNDVNFWQESPSVEGPPIIGRQRGGELEFHIGPKDQDPQTLVVTQAVEWLAGDDRPVLHEHRELATYYDDRANALVLTWTSRLSSADVQKSLRLNGERYFGLGMRFVEAMDKGGVFSFASDRSADPVNENENLIHASWCSYRAKVSGNEVTIAVFSNPTNVRQPTLWFTMMEPFAYLAATLGLHDHPLELPAGKTLELLYGVAVCDGALGHEETQRLYQAWLRQAR